MSLITLQLFSDLSEKSSDRLLKNDSAFGPEEKGSHPATVHAFIRSVLVGCNAFSVSSGKGTLLTKLNESDDESR
jgi:hypothetical protein